MISSRLSLALDTGALSLPHGRIAVFGPRAGDDLSDLPRDRVHVIQGFRPDHDFFAGAGWEVAAEPEGTYDASIICLPRARAAGQGLVAQAVAHLAPGAQVIVDGQKTDGIDAMLRALRGRVQVSDPLSKAHGKLFAFTALDAAQFDDWQARPHQIEGGFQTRPGVFSADGIDKASTLLAAALPAQMPKRVCDLGAGWGYLSSAVLERAGVEEVHLVEADHTALEAARVNITDPRARFHWADALRFTAEGRFDAIVMNPPFHTSRKGEPAIGAAFIAAAAGLLSPSGTLWLVANRHLPYEDALKARFRELEEIAGSPAFKIYRAAKPAAPAKAPNRTAPRRG